MIHSYIHTLADVFQSSRVLFVKPSNCNVNLKQTLYSFEGNRLNKGLSDTCKYLIQYYGYYTFYPFVIIIISVQSKNTYFHLFNFQHIL